MPYKKIRHQDGSYSVVNAESGKMHAKDTTEDKADAQLRLLRAYEHDATFVPRKRPTRAKR
jgi:hypothetical protein